MTIKRICTDDFGNDWFEFSNHHSQFWPQKVPSWHYHYNLPQLHDGGEWIQPCNIEVFVNWGLVKRDEVMESGFTLRW